MNKKNNKVIILMIMEYVNYRLEFSKLLNNKKKN